MTWQIALTAARYAAILVALAVPILFIIAWFRERQKPGIHLPCFMCHSSVPKNDTLTLATKSDPGHLLIICRYCWQDYAKPCNPHEAGCNL